MRRSESAAVSWAMKIVYGWAESVLKESTAEKHARSGIWKGIEYSFDSFHNIGHSNRCDIHLQLVKNIFRMLRPTWKGKCQQTKKWTNTNYASAFSYLSNIKSKRICNMIINLSKWNHMITVHPKTSIFYYLIYIYNVFISLIFTVNDDHVNEHDDHLVEEVAPFYGVKVLSHNLKSFRLFSVSLDFRCSFIREILNVQRKILANYNSWCSLFVF